MSDGAAIVCLVGDGWSNSHLIDRLLNSAFSVTVVADGTRDVAGARDRGIHVVKNVSDVTQANVYLTWFGRPEDAEDAYLGDGGIIATAKKGSVALDFSTSSMSLARELSDVARVHDITAIDAPVFERPSDAKLVSFVGAEAQSAEGFASVFEALDITPLFLGTPGCGQAMRLACIGAASAISIGLSEALCIANTANLPLQSAQEALATALDLSSSQMSLVAKMSDAQMDGRATVASMVTGLSLLLEAAETLEVTLPGAETSNELYGLVDAIGGSQLGAQAVILAYQDEKTCSEHGLDWSALDAEDDDHHGHDEGCSCGHDHHGHSHDCDCHDDFDDEEPLDDFRFFTQN